MLGYLEEEMVGHYAWEFVHEEEIGQAIKAAIASGTTPSRIVECSYIRRDGNIIAVLIDERLLRDEEGRVTGRRCTIQDVTELKRAQERLQEAGRLASIGELAAGVAHEINNPLTSILGFSELLAAGDLPESAKNDLEKISSDARRAARVVQNLLSFSRRRTPSKQFGDVAEIVKKSLEIKAYDLQVSNIQITTDLSEDVPNTMLDEYELVQVMVNLMTNAEQAMTEAHGGGQLTIRTTTVGDAIRISVTDDGGGFAPENINRIFDPFFTTKEVGKGTGLGLSICYGIVQQHGGQLWAENSPGGGARFHIELPVVGPDGEDELHDPILDEAAGSRKHILVVDDEANIRGLIARELASEGHDVDLARDGGEAWSKLQRRAYDHVLLGLKMPGMSGQELYGLIRESDSRMADKVIFITGDTLSAETFDFLSAAGNPSLSKPFHGEQLRQVIRDQEEAKYD